MILRVLPIIALACCAGAAHAQPPDPLVIESPAGDVGFRHGAHAGVSCATCHHTFPGERIKRACRSCHRPDSDMPRNSRDAFHGSCIGCHLGLYKSGMTSVPAKRCSGCHADRDRP